MYSTSVPDNQSDLTNINKAIYGKDTRRDAHEITAETVKDSKIVLSSLESVSAIFESTDIIDQKNGTSCLRYSTFEQYILRKYQVPLAKNQRFHNQPSAALGTAFLVTPTLIVTARHCVYDTEWEDLEELLNNIIKMPIVNADKVLNDVQFKQIMNKLKLLPGIIPTDIDEIFHAADKNMLNIRLNKLLATFTKLPKLRDINKLKFVFGYKMTNDNVATTMFNNEDIYSGVRVIDCLYKVEDGEDWAIIELDRPVKNCTPVKLRQQGKIEDKTPLYVLGYPSGLPIKYADGAEVRINSNREYFVANLCTFRGNSGSPVFNANTHEVEGILVSGSEDYIKQNGEIVVATYPVNIRMESCQRLWEIIEVISSFQSHQKSLIASYTIRAAVCALKLDYKKALAYSNIALEINKINLADLGARLPILLALEMYDEFKKCYEIAKKLTTDPEFLLVIDKEYAAYLINRGEYEAAITILTKMIEKAKFRAVFYMLRGEAFYASDKYQKAKDDFTRVIELGTELSLEEVRFHALAIEAKLIAIPYVKRGLCNRNLELNEEAAKDFETALVHEPLNFDAARNLAKTYQALKQFDLALEWINKALTLRWNTAISIEDKSECYNTRGTMYVEMKRYADALRDFEGSSRLDSNNILAKENATNLRKYIQHHASKSIEAANENSSSSCTIL